MLRGQDHRVPIASIRLRQSVLTAVERASQPRKAHRCQVRTEYVLITVASSGRQGNLRTRRKFPAQL
jgi:hypothetical protein